MKLTKAQEKELRRIVMTDIPAGQSSVWRNLLGEVREFIEAL